MKDIERFEKSAGMKFVGKFGGGLFFLDNIGCPFATGIIFIYAPSAKYGYRAIGDVNYPDCWNVQLADVGIHLGEDEQNALLRAAISAINNGEVRTA